MGRTASHIALECGLQTHANVVLVGEEIRAKQSSLKDIIAYLKGVIVKRSQKGKNYGLVIVPEGLIEFIPEVDSVIKEINQAVGSSKADPSAEYSEFKQQLFSQMSKESVDFLEFLPPLICESVLTLRDNHGMISVGKIETEKMLIAILEKELREDSEYKAEFLANAFYFGYEGRCAMPTNFDSCYCYALGANAANLVCAGKSGVMSVVTNLKESPEKWQPGGLPIVTLMHLEQRGTRTVPAIAKALVDLNGDMFSNFLKIRQKLEEDDYYLSVGPIQMSDNLIRPPLLVEAKPIEFNMEMGDFLRKEGVFGVKNCISEYGKKMMNLEIELPDILKDRMTVRKLENTKQFTSDAAKNVSLSTFPNIIENNNELAILKVVKEFSSLGIDNTFSIDQLTGEIKIGVVFCGRQSPGANNILDGLLKFKETAKSAKITIYGFIYGYKGLAECNYIEVKEETFKYYRNQGSMDYLGRYKDILVDGQKEKVLETCQKLGLSGLILAGSSITFTEALYLNEYLLAHDCKTGVVTVPLSVSGSLIHNHIETSIGFDTASRVYSELIGNVMTDCSSAAKYWFFIRLMGKNSSQLVLEAAMQTHPNYAIIAEEVFAKGQTLTDVVNQICDLVVRRAEQGKNFGTVLLPECLLTYIQQFNTLITEINKVVNDISIKRRNSFGDWMADLKEALTPWSYALFASLPEFTQKQLVTERDSSGNIQVSVVETEKLLAFLVEEELKKRKAKQEYSGKFGYVCHFFGYQGRSAFPTIFDCSYATACGFFSAVLLSRGYSSYCVLIKNLSNQVKNWRAGAYPLISLIKGTDWSDLHPTIPIYGTDLTSNSFLKFEQARPFWFLEDNMMNPGPIQHFDFDIDERSKTLKLNHETYQRLIGQINAMCDQIKKDCVLQQSEDFLKAAICGLESTSKIIELMKNK